MFSQAYFSVSAVICWGHRSGTREQGWATNSWARSYSRFPPVKRNLFLRGNLDYNGDFINKAELIYRKLNLVSLQIFESFMINLKLQTPQQIYVSIHPCKQVTHKYFHFINTILVCKNRKHFLNKNKWKCNVDDCDISCSKCNGTKQCISLTNCPWIKIFNELQRSFKRSPFYSQLCWETFHTNQRKNVDDEGGSNGQNKRNLWLEVEIARWFG